MIDLHLHSSASDGRLTPSELVRQAAAAGLSVISVTDHDTTSGLDEARQAARSVGIRLVNGIEITAIERGRDVHVLAYFFDHRSTTLAKLLEMQRHDRVRRVREMGTRLRQLGCPVDIERLVQSVPQGRSIGRPQLADALVAAGYVTDRRDAFDRFLAMGRPAFVPRRGPTVADVVERVTRARGVTSLAHPGLTAMDEEIPRFRAAGVLAIEARHSDHEPATERWYLDLAAALGLLVTGGSDYHADPAHHANVLGRVSMTAAEFDALENHARLAGAVMPE